MKTILVASQKGGSGKTTLAAHLSVEACGLRLNHVLMKIANNNNK